MPLAANALTTVENVQAFYSGLTDNGLVESAINAVSDALEGHLGLSLGAAQTVEHVAGKGRRVLILRRKPITVVTEVKLDGTVITDYEAVADRPIEAKRGWLIRKSGWPANNQLWWDVTLDSNHVDTQGNENVEVTYTAGYVLPSAGGSRTLPYDLEQVVIDLVGTNLTQGRARAAIEERIPGGALIKWASALTTEKREEMFLSIRRYGRC